MTQTDSPPSNQKPLRSPRRWFRFSLRTLLIMFGVAGAFLGLVVVPAIQHHQFANRQFRAIQQIKANGGHITLEGHISNNDDWNSQYYHYVEKAYVNLKNGVEIDWSALPKLQMINLENSGNKTNIELINEILKNPALTNDLRIIKLGSSDKEITDETMQTLTRFKRLEQLNIHVGNFTDQGFQQLGKCEKLRRIDIVKSVYNKSSLDLECLADLKEMESLRLIVTSPVLVNNENCHFDKLSNLRTVVLGASQFSDAALARLSELPALESLWLMFDRDEFGKFTKSNYDSISRMSQLRSLGLLDATITAEGFKTISNLENLKELSISGKFQYADLELLAHSKSIDSLKVSNHIYIGDGGVSDDAIDSLLKLKNIKSLNLDGSRLTDEGLSRLSKMENIEDLSIMNCESLSPDGLDALVQFKSLKKVHTFRHMRRFDESVIESLKKRMPQVEFPHL